MDETFSSIECITECMSDTERTKRFVEAIERIVRPGDTVSELGTGSAILALAAARAGAQKVFAVEFDPYVAKLAQENIDRNGFGNVVELKLTDARLFALSEKPRFDVVIAELLTTGLVDEHQVWAVNNLHEKGYVDEKTRFLPECQDTYIELIQKDFSVLGFDMRMVRHIWSWLPDLGVEPLSEKKLLNSVSFQTRNDLIFKTRLSLPVTKPGVLNSVRLTSKTRLDGENELGDTLALNAPVVFPLETDVKVSMGEVVNLEVMYTFGGGYRNFTVKSI